MRKGLKRVIFCFLAASAVWFGALMADRNTLNEALIRLHVVANSDSAEDQCIKLQVRDAVIGSLQAELSKLTDVDAARAYLQENLPEIQEIACRTLTQAGMDSKVTVTLGKETFDTRNYETFSLPAGVYESLRIVIGEGKGHNWWCVAFPSLCLPRTQTDFEDTAVGAGFSEALSDTLIGEEGYKVRFFLLDKLGQLENIFFAG